jgi:arginyl-tRNA synthetase
LLVPLHSMKNIHDLLIAGVLEAAQALYGASIGAEQIQLQNTRKEFEGDITLVVFPMVKISKKGPEQTAQEVGTFLQSHVELVAGFNVVKGFLNLVISSNYWLEFVQKEGTNTSFGLAAPNSKPRVMVEYASPNTNKPLHLGHLRNIFLGAAVAEILKANGHAVTKVQIINDRGIHICKSMVAWQKFGNGETPQSSGLKGDKLVGKYYVAFDQAFKAEKKALEEQGVTDQEAPIMLEAQEMLRKWEAKDAEVLQLWETMNGWVYVGFNASYATMGVTFDKLYYESQTYLSGREEVLEGLKNGVFTQKEDGSIWVDLTPDGLDEKVLLRKDGTAMYITQDIGTAILRFKDYPDTAYQIYTVGNEQEYHFKVLFKVLEKLGWDQAKKCYHLSYGMVELPEGKMKSREGTVVDADDIMAEMKNVAREVAEEQGKLDGLNVEEKEALYHVIGMASLKYFLLRVDPTKNMLFNPKESIDFNGHTGPFIQYGYVRTRALARRNEEAKTAWTWGEVSLNDQERTLVKKLHDFPAVLKEAGDRFNPSMIANYSFELIKDFNSFYQHCSILKEENKAQRQFRLDLTSFVGLVTQMGMRMLGVDMPERM